MRIQVSEPEWVAVLQEPRKERSWIREHGFSLCHITVIPACEEVAQRLTVELKRADCGGARLGQLKQRATEGLKQPLRVPLPVTLNMPSIIAAVFGDTQSTIRCLDPSSRQCYRRKVVMS